MSTLNISLINIPIVQKVFGPEDNLIVDKLLKEKLNNGKYTNILSEDFTSSHIVLKNTDLVRFPFLTYTIKLK